MLLSRRHFLQLFGLSAIALPQFPLLNALHGRALEAVSLYTKPDLQSLPISTLWPDSIHLIQPYNKSWLKVGTGFVPITAFQPILLPRLQVPLIETPSWVEVVAPFAAIRHYCASTAPLIARVGHGAVLFAQRSLVDDANHLWLQVHVGWLQANHVQPITLPKQTARQILIVSKDTHLEIYGDQKRLMRILCRRPQNLPSQASLLDLKPSDTATNHPRLGSPWQLHFDGVILTGAFWHNRFGEYTQTDCIELSTVAARTLYSWVYHAKSIQFIS